MLEELMQDQKGFALSTTAIAIITAVAGVLGISAVSTVDWTFMLASMIFVVIALGLVGSFFFGVPLELTIALSVVSLGVVALLEIGTLPAIGLMLVGGAIYRFESPSGVNLYVMVGMIGLGVLAAVFGTQFGIVESIEGQMEVFAP